MEKPQKTSKELNRDMLKLEFEEAAADVERATKATKEAKKVEEAARRWAAIAEARLDDATE